MAEVPGYFESKAKKIGRDKVTKRLFSVANRCVTHKPGFAIKGEAGQVQGCHPCRGSRAAEALAGRDGAKTCATIKGRAGAAEKVPQNRPYIIELTV